MVLFLVSIIKKISVLKGNNMKNIHILHEKINNIINIDGISPKDDGSYKIHYSYNKEPTLEELSQIQQIIDNWPIESAKTEKIEELDNQWDSICKNGWTTPYGWKLGLSINDVTLLTGLFVLAKEANQLGLTDPISIIDTDSVPHSLSLQDLTMLMLQYGNARAQLSSQYANIKSQINNLSSIEEINNFNIKSAFGNQ
jgi:hypothetical protein